MASFRKRGNKWEYRISFMDRQTGKQKSSSKSGFKTKKEAQIAALSEEQKIHHYGFSENGDELVSHYMVTWLHTYKKPFLKPITYTLQERVVRLNIIPRWGNYRLKDINRNEYQQWINELIKHYSEGTTRRIHSIFNSALFNAVNEYHILRENPILKIKIPRKNTDKEIKYFSREVLDKFLDKVAEPQKKAKYNHSIQYYVLFSFMARTGLRIGETLALTWDDIDLVQKTVNINKTLVYPLNSTPYLSTPKSKNSLRNIKLDDYTVNLLRKHKINRKEVVLKYKNYKQPEKNLVFYQHDGRWLRTNVVREYFKEICKRAKIPVLSPHALRHSHAVHLLESGANIKYVSERLGHASIKTTADTYLHVTKKIEDDALEMYQRYINS